MLFQYLAKSASIERNLFFKMVPKFLVPGTFSQKKGKNQEKWPKYAKNGQNMAKIPLFWQKIRLFSNPVPNWYHFKEKKEHVPFSFRYLLFPA